MMKRFLLSLSILVCFGFTTYAKPSPHLYITANPINQGDMNQVEGIQAALQDLFPQKMSSQFLDARNPEALAKPIKEDLKHKQEVILIGSGEGGVEALKDLSSNPNLIVCLTSHMLLGAYKDPALLERVTFIALPTHVSSEDKKIIGAKLIETVGVSHNRQAKEVEKTYQKGAKELPSCPTYLAVILGGDAPLPPPLKGMKWFKEEDVDKLAAYIAPQAKARNACVIVLNGPRTGKYDKNQKENLNVHRNGQSDPISQRFLQKLKDQGIVATFFDFQHKNPDNKKRERPYNSFDLVVGALRAHDGLLLVPGESTSMVSEAIDLLPPGKILVYTDGAMNDVHKAHIASELKAGRTSVLQDYVTIQAPSASSESQRTNAAKTIAKAIRQAAINRWK